jgi:hypothetical protein
MEDKPTKRGAQWSAGLIFGCPMGECLSGCPLAGIRKLKPKERWETFQNLREKEIKGIHDHHKECLRKRENPA